VNQYFGGSFQCPWGDCFRLIARGDLQWESYDFGLPWQSFGPGRLSLGNLNGDDHKDVLQVAYNRAAPPEEHWFLALWTGNEQSDFYSSIFELTQFASGPDSSFTSPQLCEIDGTHGAELVVLFEMTGGDARPVFYEIAGAWPNLIFTRRDEWGVGEWPTFERIRLADIDGDGLSELMGLANGEWQSWFYRQGAWGEYRNILPEFESSDVSFVDYDADGDLDLFTLADVYLNLTPDAADDPPVFVPQTLSLSTYPNPFNGEVHFVYELAVSGEVSLTLFDIQGRIVQTLLAERQAVGRHELAWDAGDLTSGVYFAKLEGMGGNRVAKLLLVK
jgi:hypothetical protein